MLVVVFAPQIFSGSAYSNGDPLLQYYPNFSFYKTQITSSQNFLWTTSFLSGFPVYLDLSGSFFSPVNYLLFKYFSVFTAYNLAILTAVSLIFLSTYFFTRQISISRTGSLVTAVAFTFGYHISNWSNVIPSVNTYFLMPLLFIAVRKIYSGKWYWALIAGVGTGYALLVAHPEWVLLSFVGSGFYVLYLLCQDYKNKNLTSGGKSSKPWPLAVGFMAIIIIGVAIASFQIIPSQKLADLSSRANGLSLNDAQVSSQTPIDWLWYLLPEFQVRYLSTSEPTLYIGILPFILAVIGGYLVFKKGDNSNKFFVGLFVFGLVTALRYSPVFWLFHQLPVFDLFRGSNRWMYLGNFGLAVLAGIGFDSIRLSQIPAFLWSKMARVFKWLIIVGGGLVAAVNIIYYIFSDKIIRFLQNYYDDNYYQYSTKLPLAHYHNVISSLVNSTFENISLLNIKFFIPAIFIVIGYIFVRRMRDGRIFAGKYFSLAIVALSFVNLASLHPNFYQIFDKKIIQEQPEIARVIKEKEGAPLNNMRTFSFLTGSGIDQKLDNTFYPEVTEEDHMIIQRDLMVVNLNMLYGVDSIDGYNNLMSRRNSRLLAALGSHRTTVGDSLAYAEGTIPDKISIFLSRLSLLSMMNVKYIISLYELPSTKDLSLVYTAYSTRFNVPIYLYENNKVLPRIYLANSVTILPDQDELNNFDIVANPINDFNQKTYLECNNCQDSKNIKSKNDKLKIHTYRDGFLELDVNIDQGRWLIFSESNLPGWRATIEGEDTEIFTANYIYQGMYIPSGQHKVIIKFSMDSLIK